MVSKADNSGAPWINSYSPGKNRNFGRRQCRKVVLLLDNLNVHQSKILLLGGPLPYQSTQIRQNSPLSYFRPVSARLTLVSGCCQLSLVDLAWFVNGYDSKMSSPTFSSSFTSQFRASIHLKIINGKTRISAKINIYFILSMLLKNLF